VVIALFLGLTILKLQSGRESRTLGSKILRYTAFISACIVVGYIGAIPACTAYADMTSQKLRTLSPTGQQVLKELDAPLKITTYVNLLDKDYNIGAKKQQNVDRTRFEQYERFLPKLEMEYVYYYDTCDNSSLFGNKINKGLSLEQVAQNVADSYKLDLEDFLNPQQIRAQIDLSAEGNRFVRVLESKGQKTFLRLYNDFFKHPGEPNIVAAIKRLNSGTKKIAFLQGHDLRSIQDQSDRGYGQSTSDITQRNALVNNGFDAISIDLNQSEIPADITTLVIADPRNMLTAHEYATILHYIDKGGHVLLTAEPEHQQYLKPIFEPLGISFLAGEMVQENEGMAANVVYAKFGDYAGILGADYQKYNQDTLFKTVMLSPGALTFEAKNNFEGFPLLHTDPKHAWLKKTRLNNDSLRVSFESGDDRIAAVTAYALRRKVGQKNQKIAIIADADFISNLEMGTFRKTKGNNNTQFYTGLFYWFSDGEYPVNIPALEPVDNDITISAKGVSTLRIIYVYLLPIALLLGGALLLYLRKRK